ncbi:hypothetical protein [Filimonas effusa]|uniref:Uncharacterized protein n=1 Tax=Filimonas effusa TaxID=2508721 RepID=A0A4Q1DE93_9BACT|nr:hypothetical protein [Filimonas effusa]RXK87013.1 hypothetical protein ESB13_09585 [Filimonas effusa]
MSRKNKMERKFLRFIASKQIVDIETAEGNKNEYPILEQYEEEEITFLYVYGNGWTILEVVSDRNKNESDFIVPHDWADSYFASLENAQKALFEYVVENFPAHLF